MSNRGQWVKDILLGGVLGGLVGAIIAVNFIITMGIGYDVTLHQVFDQSFAIGVVTTGILVAGPFLGVYMMRRLRHRDQSSPALHG